MGLSHSPSIVTNGLVFAYDMANTKKSWKGAPTTNVYPIDSYINWPSVTYHFWNGNNWVIDATYTHPGVEGPQGVYIGKVRKYTSGALASTWSGNSYAYILKSAVMTSGQAYAMSAYSFVSSDCNIDGMNSSIEGVGASAMSGVATGYNMAKKGTWQRQGLTCIAPATSINFIPIYPYKNGVTTGVFTGFFMVGGAMVETGSFPTPYTDGTRSNTQALVDLTGQNTITANSLTYASDGTFKFYGSNYLDASINQFNLYNLSIWLYNDYIIPGNDSAIGGIVTSYQSLINFNRQTTQGINLGGWTGGAANESVHIWSNASTSAGYNGMTYIRDVVPIGWHNFQFNWNGLTYDIWIDGQKKTTYSHSTGQATLQPVNAIRIGGDVAQSYFFVGKIPTVSIYNRQLSDIEVIQNFNALRGRYGL